MKSPILMYPDSSKPYPLPLPPGPSFSWFNHTSVERIHIYILINPILYLQMLQITHDSLY